VARAAAALLPHFSTELTQEEREVLADRLVASVALPLLSRSRRGGGSAAAAAAAAALVPLNAEAARLQLLARCAAAWPQRRDAERASSTEEEAEAAGPSLSPACAAALAAALLRPPMPPPPPAAALQLLERALGALWLGEEAAEAELLRDALPALAAAAGAPGGQAARAAALELLSDSPGKRPGSMLKAQRCGMMLLSRLAACDGLLPCAPQEEPFTTPDGADGEPLWAAVRSALAGPDTRSRKLALHVLRRGLAGVAGGDACEEGWRTLLLLFECAEDYSTHLLFPAFERLRSLHPSAGMTSPPGVTSTPGVTTAVPYPWIAALWARAVSHDNPAFRRHALAALAASEWGRGYARAMGWAALCGPLMRALNDPGNHGEGESGAEAAAGLAAAAAALAAADGDPMPPLRAAAGGAHAPVTRVGQASFWHVVCAAAEAEARSRVSERGSERVSEALELLRRAATASCAHWGASYRLACGKAALRAAAALAPAPLASGAEMEAAGRLLAALARAGMRGGGGALRAEAAGWLCGKDGPGANQSALRAAVSAHLRAFLAPGAGGESGDAAVAAAEVASMRAAARQAALLWSLLPQPSPDQDVPPATAAAAELGLGLAARAHMGARRRLAACTALTALLTAAAEAGAAAPWLQAEARAAVLAPGPDGCCAEQCAMLASVELAAAWAPPVEAGAPPLARDASVAGAGAQGDYLGGPKSELHPSRVAAGQAAAAALAVLCATAPLALGPENGGQRAGWAGARAGLRRLLAAAAAAAPQWAGVEPLSNADSAASAAAAAELRDDVLSCVALAAEALGGEDDAVEQFDWFDPLFDACARCADAGARRSAGGACAAPAGASSAAAVWAALSALLRMQPGSVAGRAHARALGAAVAALRLCARGDAQPLLRAARLLLERVADTKSEPGLAGVAAQRAAELAADDGARLDGAVTR